uniref:Uncharacterized protein n=1 Tax=Rhizophora mucronata TaxID=61149 RepID=A0A2P2PQ20_RHIMU
MGRARQCHEFGVPVDRNGKAFGRV